MKILSYNARGVGKRAKRKEVKEYVKKFRVDLCCIQETKLSKMEEPICRAIWGNNSYDWVCKEAEGTTGGILTIWNPDCFCKSSS